MLNSPLALKRLSGTVTNEDTLRVMVFAIANYSFALPVGAILKVLVCPPISATVESGIGIVDLGSQTIAVVDLRQKLFPSRQESQAWEDSSFTRRFLIVSQSRTGEPFGIMVDRPPVLTDIPLNAIRPVPLSYRQVAALSFASHMAILTEAPEKEPFEIFLLGMNQILAEKLGWRGHLSKNSLQDASQPVSQRQRFVRIAFGEQGSALLPLEAVVQVINVSPKEISLTPALPSWVVGLYHWNEQMLRLVDLNHLVGYPPLLQRQSNKNTTLAIVLEIQNQLAGFLVTNVYNVEWQDLAELKPAGADLSPPQLLNFVRGVLPGDRWLLNLKVLAEAIKWQTA